MAKKQTVDEMRKKAAEILKKAEEEELKLHAELGKKTEDFLIGKINLNQLFKAGKKLGYEVSVPEKNEDDSTQLQDTQALPHH